jgi:hypothetical protein
MTGAAECAGVNVRELAEYANRMRVGEWRGIEFIRGMPSMNKRQRQRAEALKVQQAMRAGEPLPNGLRYRTPKRSKYGDLQRLRARNGTGRPPTERTITIMPTDLVQL